MPSMKDNSTLSVLGLLLAGFLAGIGTYEAILRIAEIKKISLQRHDLLVFIENLYPQLETPSAHESTPALTVEEERILAALLAESHGIEDGVAVFPFRSHSQELGISTEDLSMAIAGLQAKGFVVLDDEDGWNELEQRSTNYPVYRVTKEGFGWAIGRNW